QDVSLPDGADAVALHGALGSGGDGVRGQTQLGRTSRVDVDRYFGSTFNNPVRLVDNAFDRGHPFTDLFGKTLKSVYVRAKNLNLNRRGRAGEITDQVSQDRDDVDLQVR